ncbi:exosortase C-terminal domain/associated protein EpsI [Trichlorobacter ammonificans]|uniref:EpsI family protein n=1 Tax=Trichlorobacter ammonificans TaxID=2916410 RepID=A0ABM9D880_9BACT|nr:exosortase C-terminal domain/associated protein EpsI [Trichlorobacter ammonificans]CAH2031417.1 EpsI family protein [Trichlorobacter ammonificans]
MIARSRFIGLWLLLAVTGIFLGFRSMPSVPVARPLAEFPVSLGEWRMVSQDTFGGDVLAILRPSDYLSRRYESADGRRIRLYVGYHDGGSESGEIHSPRHCLPGTGWQQLSADRLALAQPRGTINLARAVYQRGETRELFFYWFQVRGETLADEYRLKLAGISGALAHGRKDASFIRISVPFTGDEQQAAADGISFIRAVYPQLCRFLPS